MLVQVLFVGGMQSGVLAGVVDGGGSILDDAWLCHHDAGCIILMLFAPSWCCRTHQDVVAALNVAWPARKGSWLVPQHGAFSMIMMLSKSSCCRWTTRMLRHGSNRGMLSGVYAGVILFLFLLKLERRVAARSGDSTSLLVCCPGSCPRWAPGAQVR